VAAQNKIDSLKSSIQQILDLLKNNMSQSATAPNPQPSLTGTPFPSVEPADHRPSPSLFSQSSDNRNYKARVEDPLRFSNNVKGYMIEGFIGMLCGIVIQLTRVLSCI